ncbi:hypothetical protein LEP1GSC151_1201, partial [Leptospira interrogans serovar Grippotyphosa str. LT2186]
ELNLSYSSAGITTKLTFICKNVGTLTNHDFTIQFLNFRNSYF